jgi:hypothetical protein
MHKLANPLGSIGRWFAVALHDGTTDNVLYDSKRDAVLHQHHNEQWYAFVQVTPGDLDDRAAETWLSLHRRMYDAGIRIPDRDHKSGGVDVIKRASKEDMANQMRSMFGKGHPSNILIPGRDF